MTDIKKSRRRRHAGIRSSLESLFRDLSCLLAAPSVGLRTDACRAREWRENQPRGHTARGLKQATRIPQTDEIKSISKRTPRQRLPRFPRWHGHSTRGENAGSQARGFPPTPADARPRTRHQNRTGLVLIRVRLRLGYLILREISGFACLVRRALGRDQMCLTLPDRGL